MGVSQRICPNIQTSSCVPQRPLVARTLAELVLLYNIDFSRRKLATMEREASAASHNVIISTAHYSLVRFPNPHYVSWRLWLTAHWLWLQLFGSQANTTSRWEGWRWQWSLFSFTFVLVMMTLNPEDFAVAGDDSWIKSLDVGDNDNMAASANLLM